MGPISGSRREFPEIRAGGRTRQMGPYGTLCQPTPRIVNRRTHKSNPLKPISPQVQWLLSAGPSVTTTVVGCVEWMHGRQVKECLGTLEKVN